MEQQPPLVRRYKVDPITTTLATGGRPDTWGLNASAHALLPPALREPYQQFAEQLSKSIEGSGAYVYPYEYLHITASSPAPFTHTTISGAEQIEFESAILQAMRDECIPTSALGLQPTDDSTASACRGYSAWPSSQFPLIYENPRLESAAGIFFVTDPEKGVERVRQCLKRVYEHPAVAAWASKAQWRTPGIVHSTFLRFGSAPDPDITDDDIASRFQDAAKTWSPVTVVADSLVLVREIKPYMHLEVGKGSVHEQCVIGDFPFGPS